MRHSILTLLLSFAAAALVLSCEKKEETPNTSDTPGGTPSISITEQGNFSIAFDAASSSIHYTVTNPVEGGQVIPEASADWITELDTSVEGTVTILTEENTDTVSRNAILTLRYEYEGCEEDIKAQIGKGKTLATYHKYSAAGKHFENFLKLKYGRMDIMPSELTHVIIHDFDIYLRTVVSLKPNSATKTLKFFKTVVIFAQKCGVLTHDPFAQHRFHLESVDRGFLTDEEITRIMEKEFFTPRLESVRDIFIFSCFCGLAYIDVANLTQDNIVTLDGKKWIMTRRQKTRVESNILLLDIPLMIINKYKGKTKDGKLLPILSNQKMNAYLKEIADLCGIKKRLTYHLASHSKNRICLYMR